MTQYKNSFLAIISLGVKGIWVRILSVPANVVLYVEETNHDTNSTSDGLTSQFLWGQIERINLVAAVNHGSGGQDFYDDGLP